MKFTYSENYSYRSGIRVPKPWLTKKTDKENFIFIREFVIGKYWVYDTDQCGDVDYYFVFDNGEMYKCSHSYYLNWEHDEESCDYHVVNEIDVEKIDPPDYKLLGFDHKERDYI